MIVDHDFHIHTHLSVPSDNLEAGISGFIAKARIRLKKLGFVDHVWDSAIPGAHEYYVSQDLKRLQRVKEMYVEVHTSDVQLYFGCETEYDYAHRSDFIEASNQADIFREKYDVALYEKPKKVGKFLENLKENGYYGYYIYGKSIEIQSF